MVKAGYTHFCVSVSHSNFCAPLHNNECLNHLQARICVFKRSSKSATEVKLYNGKTYQGDSPTQK